MARGVRSTPNGVLNDLRDLIDRQATAADAAVDQIAALAPPEIEIGYPADDHEAQALGWPSVGAWRGMAARVVADLDVPVVLVPRGSTPATAGAIDEHES